MGGSVLLWLHPFTEHIPVLSFLLSSIFSMRIWFQKLQDYVNHGKSAGSRRCGSVRSWESAGQCVVLRCSIAR
jgi:hypothetical protein